MRGNALYDLLAPVYGRVLAGMLDLVVSRAWQRLAAGAPATVLEVGVGPGDFLTHMATKSDGQVVGIDLSDAMLQQAKKKLDGAKRQANLVRADVLALPFRPGHFEAAGSLLLFDVLGRDDVRRAVVETARVIAPGGRAVIGSIRFANVLVKRSWMLAYNLLPGIVGSAEPTDVDDFLDEAGLRVIRDEEINGLVGLRLLTLMKVVG